MELIRGDRLAAHEERTIDWYDGVISSLLDFGDGIPSHLCLGIAWSAEHDVRVYGLVPIADTVAEALRTCLGRKQAATKESWAEIVSLLAKGQAAHVGPVVVLAAEVFRPRRVLGWAAVPAEDVPELARHERRVEETHGPGGLEMWLARLGVPMPPHYLDEEKLRFGQYMEVSGPGWERRAEQIGVSAADRDALIEDFSGRLLQIGTHAGSIVSTLGAPREDLDEVLRYDLGLRPEYYFEFRVRPEEQTVIDSGYVRRKTRVLSLALPTTAAEASACRAEAIRLGVTAPELVAQFGEPEDRTGWWPYETWTYPGALMLELRLGVVEG